jgi:hypothetical protein
MNSVYGPGYFAFISQGIDQIIFCMLRARGEHSEDGMLITNSICSPLVLIPSSPKPPSNIPIFAASPRVLISNELHDVAKTFHDRGSQSAEHETRSRYNRIADHPWD